MSERMPWAYVCVACNHLASGHHLVEGGDLRAGPYRCRECPCEIGQDAAMHSLDRGQWMRFMAQRTAEREPVPDAPFPRPGE